MKPRSRALPVWLMGLSNLPYGFYNGIVVIALPQILVAQHVPEQQITTITAIVFAGAIFGFVLGPLLDVRFSRRWYASAFVGLSGVCLLLGLVWQNHVALLEATMFAGFLAATVAQNALGGWLATIVAEKDESRLSAWTQVGSFGGAGLMSIVSGEVIRAMPPLGAGLVLAAIVMLPTAIYLWMPAPGADRRLARESFGKFFSEVFAVVRRREALIALVLFLAPTGCFTLTNLLGGLGNEFQASPRVVSMVGGAGLSAAGIVGSLLFVPLGKRWPLRPLYLGIGIVGAVFTFGLLLLPHTPLTFCVALIGENVFQALAITGSVAIMYETIGRNNPFAATQYSLLFCASSVSIAYMQVVDGRGYGWRGVAGMFVADAGSGIVACVVMAAVLVMVGRAKRVRG